jgi:hypothetical protein
MKDNMGRKNQQVKQVDARKTNRNGLERDSLKGQMKR